MKSPETIVTDIAAKRPEGRKAMAARSTTRQPTHSGNATRSRTE